MEESHSFVPLLIVALLGFLVPFALTRFKRLRLPVVVGEILAGIIIGDSGLQWVRHDPMLEVLSLLGFAYLMFLSGLEVDFAAILPKPGTWRGSWRDRISNPLGMGLLIFAATLIIATLAGWGLYAIDTADDPWLLSLILSTTSLGVVVPILKERDLLNKAYGQALLIAAVIADFGTMILVSIYIVIRSTGLSPDVMLVLLLFGAFATAYRLASMTRRRFPGLDFFQNISEATSQIDVRGAFAIGLAFIALAQGLGVEMILGAFLGGALISLLADRGSSDLHHRLDVIGYSFFIPIFFIMVGVRFDLASVFSSSRAILLVVLLLILDYAVKVLASLLFRLSYTTRETLAGGILLSAHLSLEIAVATIGLELGVIDQATNSAIILMAVVSCTISPLVFNSLIPVVVGIQRQFVIVGAGRSARLLAKRILGHGQEVRIFCTDPKRANAAEEMDLRLEKLDPHDPETWKSIDPNTVRAVAVLLPDDEANFEVCRLVRDTLDADHIVSRVHDATLMQPFADMGVQVINPSLSPVVELEYLMLYPSVSSLITDLEDEHDIAEVHLRCAELVDRPLREIDMPEGAIIILVRRDGDVIYPRGNTQLRIGDRLTLMGPLDAVRDLAQRCQ